MTGSLPVLYSFLVCVQVTCDGVMGSDTILPSWLHVYEIMKLRLLRNVG